MRLVSTVAATSLGLVFLVAAAGKTRHPLALARSVDAYRILPRHTVVWAAFLLLGTEYFLATAFLTGWLLQGAIPIAASTLIAFACAVAINLRRNRRIPCGCFGDPEERISERALVRLTFLLIAVGLVSLEVFGKGAARTTTLMTTHDMRYGLEVATLALATTLLAAWFLALLQLLHETPHAPRSRRRELGSPANSKDSEWT